MQPGGANSGLIEQMFNEPYSESANSVALPPTEAVLTVNVRSVEKRAK